MMKTRHFKSILVILVIALLPLSFACRTKSKTTPQTQPVTDTVVDTVAPAPTPTPTMVEDRDFVEPAVTEEIPSDLDELNRVAHARGWIKDAFFNYDEATLSADAQEALTDSALWLKNHPNYNLLIEGHADARGTEQYNLALGDRRANTARDYMLSLGLDAGRIDTISYGEERPFSMGTTESAYAQNRRAHLVLRGR